jgi:hypothetical protein
MWALDVKKMESFFKIDLRDVSWWKSINKYTYPRSHHDLSIDIYNIVMVEEDMNIHNDIDMP